MHAHIFLEAMDDFLLRPKYAPEKTVEGTRGTKHGSERSPPASGDEVTPAAGDNEAPGESVAAMKAGDGVNGATGGPSSNTWLFPGEHVARRRTSETREARGGGTRSLLLVETFDPSLNRVLSADAVREGYDATFSAFRVDKICYFASRSEL